jgi:hypothetical protein
MNTQEKHFFNTQGFRIGLIALLAVALMAGAAFWFGTGLRAETEQSVAASPPGSSLTAIRESRLDDYYGRFSNSSAAARSASLAALAKTRSDFYGDLNAAAAASRWAAVAARDDSLALFYIALKGTNAAADASRSASQAALASSRAGFYAQLNSSPAAARAAGLVGLAKSRSDFYAELNNSSAADSYQNEWMGFTAPESVGARVGARPSKANHSWIKPEGIKPSAAVDSAAHQYQWIKPEGMGLSTP